MSMAELGAIERIARVLAGLKLSANGEGTDPSASHKVDAEWPEHREEALAVLRTLREPDLEMARAGDAEIWRQMIDAALQHSEADRV